MAVALLSGYMVLQYADVRSAYPAALTGRAMAAFTMALFLGVALMQWVTGMAASLAPARGVEPYAAVMLTIALMLVLGALAFKCLPAPAHLPRAPVPARWPLRGISAAPQCRVRPDAAWPGPPCIHRNGRCWRPARRRRRRSVCRRPDDRVCPRHPRRSPAGPRRR